MESGMIQRYAYNTRNFTTAIGVYSRASTFTFDVLFNLTLNYFVVNSRSYDDVTDQQIDAYTAATINGLGNTDNPGIVPPDTPGPVFAGKSSVVNAGAPMHVTFPAGSTISVSVFLYLPVVTANVINNFMQITLGYMAPKDYLSTTLGAG